MDKWFIIYLGFGEWISLIILFSLVVVFVIYWLLQWNHERLAFEKKVKKQSKKQKKLAQRKKHRNQIVMAISSVVLILVLGFGMTSHRATSSNYQNQLTTLSTTPEKQWQKQVNVVKKQQTQIITTLSSLNPKSTNRWEYTYLHYRETKCQTALNQLNQLAIQKGLKVNLIA